MPTHDAFVTKAGATIVVRRKKQTVFECALDHVESLAIEGEGIVVSTTLVRDCVEREIAVILCTRTGIPFARLAPARARRRSDAINRQVAARHDATGTRIARAIVSAKIANQRSLLLYHTKYARRAGTVRESLERAAEKLSRFRADSLSRMGPSPKLAARSFSWKRGPQHGTGAASRGSSRPRSPFQAAAGTLPVTC